MGMRFESLRSRVEPPAGAEEGGQEAEQGQQDNWSRAVETLEKRIKHAETSIGNTLSNFERSLKESRAPQSQQRSIDDIRADLEKAHEDGESSKFAELTIELNQMLSKAAQAAGEGEGEGTDAVDPRKLQAEWHEAQPWRDPDHPQHDEIVEYVRKKELYLLRAKGMTPGPEYFETLEQSIAAKFPDVEQSTMYSDPDAEPDRARKTEDSPRRKRYTNVTGEDGGGSDVSDLLAIMDANSLATKLHRQEAAEVHKMMRTFGYDPMKPDEVEGFLRAGGRFDQNGKRVKTGARR